MYVRCSFNKLHLGRKTAIKSLLQQCVRRLIFYRKKAMFKLRGAVNTVPTPSDIIHLFANHQKASWCDKLCHTNFKYRSDTDIFRPIREIGDFLDLTRQFLWKMMHTQHLESCLLWASCPSVILSDGTVTLSDVVYFKMRFILLVNLYVKVEYDSSRCTWGYWMGIGWCM